MSGIETYCIEARKAAHMYADVLDACPYPFSSIAGQVFQKEFAREREVIAKRYAERENVKKQE